MIHTVTVISYDYPCGDRIDDVYMFTNELDADDCICYFNERCDHTGTDEYPGCINYFPGKIVTCDDYEHACDFYRYVYGDVHPVNAYMFTP